MKKTLCSLLIIAILMNFICGSICYADGADADADESQKKPETGAWDSWTEKGATPTSQEETDKATGAVIEGGEVEVKGKKTTPSLTQTAVGAVMGYLALLIDILPLQVHMLLSSFVYTLYKVVPAGFEDFFISDFFISIDRIVFNRIPLFNINYFNYDDTYSVGTGDYYTEIQASKENTAIKTKIAEWYMKCRILALIISLIVLIYIGIRMALSTIASDKAKYKKMLLSWVESVVLLFSLHYIMVIIINFGEVLTDVFYNIKLGLQSSGEKSFEFVITDSIISSIFDAAGLQLVTYSIMYWVLVFVQVKFLYLYMKRTLVVGFLIMIAPLITITYPIDKAGDGRAQAFSKWMSEFLINVLIQPLHAIIYIVFMFTAGEIAKYAPILGLIFMLSLGTVEKTVLRIFNTGSKALGGLDDFKPKK